jgi:phosphatidylinositol glycan class B
MTAPSPRFIGKLWFLFVILHLLASIFSEGFHRPDEHLGMIRMMMLKLGTLPESLISWEIGAQIRSWLQPMLYFCLFKTLNTFGVESPRLMAFSFRLIMALAHLWAIRFLIQRIRLSISSNQTVRWIEFFIYTAWFFPFIHVRTTTESFASIGICLLLGLYYQLTYNKFSKPSSGILILIGLLISTTIFARLQTVLFLVPIIPYVMLVKPHWQWRILGISTWGIILGICLNISCDWWGYGNLTMSPWNNLYQNLFLGVAAGFGKSPWYYYLTKLPLKAIPLYAIPLIVLFIVQFVKFPTQFLTVATVLFIMGHSSVSHKELRFLYPVAIPFLILAGLSMSRLSQNNFALFRHKFFPLIKYGFLGSALVAAIYSSLTPAYGIIGLYNFLYKKPITQVVTLNVVRDPLVFYMGREVEFKYVASEDLQEALSLKNPYILTDKYHHHLQLQKTCRTEFLSSSLLLYQLFPKYSQRSKIWGLYYCPNFDQKE